MAKKMLATSIMPSMKLRHSAVCLLVVLLSGCLGSAENAVDAIIQDPDGDVGTSALKFNPEILNLGNSQLSPAYVEATVDLENTAPKPIFIKSFSVDNTEFSVVDNSCAMSPLSLDSGSTCQLKIRFSPGAQGDRSGTLLAQYGLDIKTPDKYRANLGLAGRQTADGIGNSGLTFTPSVYDFGDVALAPVFQDRSFTLRNVTLAPLYLTGFSVDSTMFSIQSSTCPVTPVPIAVNATCSVVVRYSPLATGRHTGFLTSVYGTSDLQPTSLATQVALSGSSTNGGAGNAVVTFAPSYWDYGDQRVGVTATKTFTVANTGSTSIYISTVSPNPSLSEFVVTGTNCPMGLNAFASGASCTITATFSPASEGIYTTSIELKYGPDVPRSSSLSSKFTVAGRATPTPLGVSGISFSPDYWDFGDIAHNATASKAIVITNTSTSEIFISSVVRTSTSLFGLSHNCPISPSTLAAGATCTATATFTPSTDGIFSSDLAVNYGPDAPRSANIQDKMILIGRSSSFPFGNPTVTFNPSYWDYGDLAVGATGTKTFTITNTNATAVYMSSISPNPSSSQFVVTSTNCPSGLNPFAAGATCSATIAFTPSNEGPVFANIELKSGPDFARADAITTNLTVTGRSSPPPISGGSLGFNPPYWDFGDIAKFSSVSKAIVVTNTSPAAMVIGSIERTSTSIFSIAHNCPISPNTFATGAVCTVTVSYLPIADGSFSSDITFSFGPDVARKMASQSKMYVTGRSTTSPTGISAITYSPNYWDYGDLGIGATGTKTFTITNSGTSSVYAASIQPNPASSEFVLTSTNCPTGLNPFAASATCTATITFTPESEGAKSANIETKYGPDYARSDTLAGKLVITGRSSPAPVSSGNIGFTPSFWDFGDVARNTSVSKAITVTNNSASPVVIGNISRTSTSNFSLSHDCPLSPSALASSASCTVTMIFLPTADGSYSSDLTVSYGPDVARNTSVQSKAILVGKSIATPIGNAVVSFSPNYNDFGDIAVGANSSLLPVTVTNSGTTPIYVSSVVSTDSNFAVLNSTCLANSGVINASATCTFNLRYSPTENGIDSTSVVVSYGLDAVRNTSLNRSMVASGRSSPGGTGNTAFTFNPAYYDYGDVAAGVTVQNSFTITNSSTDPVFISNLTRTNTGVFGVSHDCPISPSSLAAGGVCTATVTFTPTADGLQTSLISVIYGPDAPRSGNLTSKFAVSGRSTAAARGNVAISYNPTYWNFGDVPANTSQNKSIVLTNSSSSSIYLSSINLDNAGSFVIASNDCPTGATPLAAAATCTIVVRFSPTTDTLENVTVRAYYGPDQARSGNLISTMIVSGRSVAVPSGQVILSATPGFQDYGDVAQGSTVSQPITITNTTGSNAYISSISRSNTGAFSLAHNCPISPNPIASLATCTVTLSFTPNAEGPHSTRVDVVHGIASASSGNLVFSFFAQGRSTAAATGNSVLGFNPDSWDFGDIAAGQVSNKTITITNTDTNAIFLGTVSADNPRFSITSNNCPSGATSFAASATCQINARFSPIADGGQNSQLTYNYGPDQARAGNLHSKMSLFGRSTAAPIGNNAVGYTPNYWDYGDVAQGQTSVKAITVRNNYSASIYISDVASSNARVTLTDNCPRSPTALAANSTCTITSTFAPNAEGAVTSDLTVTYGPDSARSGNLSTLMSVAGRSTAIPTGNPALEFTPSYHDFGNILVGQNASSSFTITNTKSLPLYLGGASVSLSEYAITSNNCPTGATALAPAATCTVSVRYTPIDESTDIGTLEMDYGPDQARNTNLVAKTTLIAKSEPPPVGNAAITMSPNTFDFGSVGLTPAYSDTIITISNTSTRTLYLGANSGLSGTPFSINATNCPSAPTGFTGGASCTMTIRFSPTAGPQTTATLTQNYGVSSSVTTDYNSQAQFTGRSNPNAPTNFRFSTGDATSATFAWDANDFDQSTFQIERCTGAACLTSFPSSDPNIPAGVDRVTGVLNTVRSFTWNNANTSLPLSEGEIYIFRIRGVAGSTKSTWLTSPPIIAFGGTQSVDNATGLSSSLSQLNCNTAAAGSYVGLSWNSVTNAAYYQVFDTASGSAQFVKNVDAPASGTILTGLGINLNKSYIVKAFTTSGVGSINTNVNSLITQSYSPCAVIGQSSPGGWYIGGGLNAPRSMWVDVTTNPKRLFVADQGNNRVLIWNSIPTSTGTRPDVVLGQPDFESNTANNSGIRTDPALVSAKSLNAPGSVFAKNGKVFVTDTSNNRVLIWNSVPTTNFKAADVVIGQANFSSRNPVGCGGTGARALNGPYQVFVDSSNAMYVVDKYNNRVLVWNSIPTVSNTAADLVLGIPTLTSACPGGIVTQSSLYWPENIYVSNNDVFVSDRSNRRVMRFIKPLSSGMNASNYWGGAGNFTTVPGAACAGNKFNDVIGIWGDSTAGSDNIYVADYGQSRVMRFASNNWGNDPTADSVIGQPNATTCTAGDMAGNIRNPISGFALNSANPEGGLWVTHYGGNRISHYSYSEAINVRPYTTGNITNGSSTMLNVANTTGINIGQNIWAAGVPNGTTVTNLVGTTITMSANATATTAGVATGFVPTADLVLQQTKFGAFHANSSMVTSQRYLFPSGVSVGNLGPNPRMATTDAGANRVLLYDGTPTNHLATATRVLGQTTMTNELANQGNLTQITPTTPSATTMNTPQGVWTDGIKLLVADSSNSRILGWRSWPTSDDQAADYVLGQTSMTVSTATISASGLNIPNDVFVTPVPGSGIYSYIWVADTNNNRIVVYQTTFTSIPLDPPAPPAASSAIFVLGQAALNTNAANTTQSGLRNPRGIWSDGRRVVVADTNNHRVMIWDGASTPTLGQNADFVLGQPDFVSNTANNGSVGSTTLNTPTSVAVDSTGRLYVVDQGNHRILVWDTFPTANAQPADRVIGQTSFLGNGTNGGGLYPAATLFNYPTKIWLDAGRIFLSDGLNVNNNISAPSYGYSQTNHRITIFPGF